MNPIISPLVNNIIKPTLLALGVSAIGTTLLTMPATAFNVSFSFQNALNGGGTVTGVIRGLEEGTRPATSVEVLDNTAGFGIGEYVGSPSNNSWTVLNGNLVEFDFLSFGSNNTPPDVTDSTLFFNSSEVIGASFRAGIDSSPNGITTGSSGVTTENIGLTFTPLDDDIEPVPEPLTILGSATALGIGGLLKRESSKKKKS